MYKCDRCDYSSENRRAFSTHYHHAHGKSIAQKSQVVCNNCGKSFYKKDLIISRTERDFCDKDCEAEWRSEERTEENNVNWKGGKTSEINEIRNSKKYKEWRINVLERDNYKCQKCGSDENLHAHHIEHLSENQSKAYDLENGITLCSDCHSKEHPKVSFL